MENDWKIYEDHSTPRFFSIRPCRRYRSCRARDAASSSFSSGSSALQLPESNFQAQISLASRQGNYGLVQWLLRNGAEDSLYLYNRMNCTPCDIARVCGPHPEVSGLLGSALCGGLATSHQRGRDGRVAPQDTLRIARSGEVSYQRGRDGRAALQDTLRIARSGETAIEMQYPCWLIPVAEVLKLSELRPHQELRAAGKLVRWNSSMTAVFFFSHQWTSFTAPDHSTIQLRTIQRLLLRMLEGNMPDTSPSFADAVRFTSKVKVTTREWKELAPRAYVWMDFMSVRSRARGFSTIHFIG